MPGASSGGNCSPCDGESGKQAERNSRPRVPVYFKERLLGT